MEQAGSLKGWDYCTALSLQYMDQLPWETEDNCCWTPRWRTNCSHRWTVDFFTDTMNTTWLCITSSRILAGSGNFTFFLLCGPSLPDSLKTTDHLKKSPVWYSERSNLEFWRKVTAAFVLWLWNCLLTTWGVPQQHCSIGATTNSWASIGCGPTKYNCFSSGSGESVSRRPVSVDLTSLYVLREKLPVAPFPPIALRCATFRQMLSSLFWLSIWKTVSS